MTALYPPPGTAQTNHPNPQIHAAASPDNWAKRKLEKALGGNQVIRVATSDDEIDEAQELRYRVFYDEMGAKPLPEMKSLRRDFDRYDNACDHLIVVDRSRKKNSQVVGTYRCMRREHAGEVGAFYSAGEYDIKPLLATPGAVMELGRSCVDAAYRDRATMQLLWRGIAEYCNAHEIRLIFGCASLPGTDPDKLATQLSYLYHHHLAPKALRSRALPERFTDMHLLPKSAINPKRAFSSLPPLIKGYLRIGAFVGDGAVIDHQFNTTDVCVIVKTDLMANRYARHYGIGER
ncbi:MAG: hemolysin-like protein [Candidatus Marinimicrobia bacterium]|nr:hemolysin-like protein [Candidatus Neomarinimicrobiota bacterium]